MHSSGAAEKGARGLEPLSNRLWRALVPSSCLWGISNCAGWITSNGYGETTAKTLRSNRVVTLIQQQDIINRNC